ncbi:ATP-binding protein [Pyrococcus kukulkanii]|uniref:ATP-binding protein n=1 Tax=Pyrococcus kukulkanii TaxID=1609559 RepID=UPI003563C093
MLELQNPWWFNEPDRDWEFFEKLTYRIKPKWLNEISLKPFSLNFIIGPRRVGKTLGVKLLIKELVKRVENRYAIFYFSCDVLEDYKDLLDILTSYLKLKKKKRVKTAFIFLDEVTLVEDWWRAIKFLIDRGEVITDVITVAGSVGITLGRYFETFGGRRGHGKTIEVMPLSFHGYYRIFYDEFFPSKGEDIFHQYLETGGYLAYLNGTLKLEDLIGFLKADLKTLNRSTELARDIVGEIIERAPSPISFNTIAKAVGISPHTVRDYIEILEALRLILQVQYLGPDGKIYPRKERKIVIRDPLIAKALEMWSRREVERATLYEWLVQEHLYRKFGEIFYYRNSYEIDAIAGNLKVEVKSGEKRGHYPKDVKIIKGSEIPEFLYWLG